jgi:hypothetical protein
MAGTSRTPDPGTPVPQGGGAAERLREFLAAREEPAPEETAEDDGDSRPDQRRASGREARPGS